MERAIIPCRLGCILFVIVAAGLSAEEVVPQYNRDVRPILAENCFSCHGPDSAARKADLRLDQRDMAMKSHALVPGKPSESEVYRRITTGEPDEVMPPPSTKKSLKPAEKEILRRWIEAGAEYQLHWSFIPPVRPTPPDVKQASWARNPIDRFVLRALEDAGLEPAPEADRRTLARRAALDLTGLPPSPEQVEAFVQDRAEGAYERYLDTLLDSAAWGEQRARYWLDVARYADTHGIHFDNYREMYAYRDWVIDAFQRNLPFDRFTIEQLAGDLLEKPTLKQLVASGFNRCNMTTNEGGTIPEEYLVLYTRDRTETTSLVWLGLTAGCGVCHNHKFDPLTQREFYELAAFFNNTTQNAMDGNIKDTPPTVPVPRGEDRERWDQLEGLMASANEAVEQHRKSARGDFEAWRAGITAKQVAERAPGAGLELHAPLAEGAGATTRVSVKGQTREVKLPGEPTWIAGHVAPGALKSTPAGAVALPDAGDFEKDQPFSCALWLKLGGGNQSGSVVARMDDEHGYRGWDLWCEGGRLGSHLVSDWDRDALRVATRREFPRDRWTHVVLTHDGSGKASGARIYVNGESQELSSNVDRLSGSMRTQVAFKLGQREKGSRVPELSLADVRLYSRALSAEEARDIAAATRTSFLLGKTEVQSSPADTEELYAEWLRTESKTHRDLVAAVESLVKEKEAIQARGTYAHVMNERAEPPSAFILFRGQYDQRRDQVQADTPDVLPPFPASFPRNRLGLARWLLLPENPLTARVTVNRFWQEVFGTGIVRTSGDFGVSGELPSNPGLLDWLAVELRESGWNVKRLFKLMLLSATYRQSAVATPAKIERDPQNRLLSRGPRFRMDAEMVRDYALAASGLLVRKVGGPSVKPYQPEGVWEAVAMMESNTRYYKQDSGENLYRRSLYTFWKRAAPPASMEIMNAPSRELCAVRRERTNTPLQALVTLNDPQFFEAARSLAERALREGGPSQEGRLDRLSRIVLLRPLRTEESAVAAQSLEGLLQFYRGNPDEASQLIQVGESKPAAALEPSVLAAWTLLANQLLNLDETLNK